MRPGRLGCAALALALVAGCATERSYPGAERPAAELATIEGAPALNAGLPLAPLLRKVDERVVGVGYSRVTVLPGTHRVLVDCVMRESHTTTRFELQIEAYPGRRYVLVAGSAPGNQRCGAVEVEER
ncbi:MAG TPA: hypothetical protein VMU00_05500 [Steroidobacteraceae bacterium]|nr:hypothetical protein [Steroidobacteraceae bacterium]